MLCASPARHLRRLDAAVATHLSCPCRGLPLGLGVAMAYSTASLAHVFSFQLGLGCLLTMRFGPFFWTEILCWVSDPEKTKQKGV